jgi:predicted RNA-binding protein with PUA-like domain
MVIRWGMIASVLSLSAGRFHISAAPLTRTRVPTAFYNTARGVTTMMGSRTRRRSSASLTTSVVTAASTSGDDVSGEERRRFLVKSEPSEFSLSDLLACGPEGDEWDGVRNYEARNILKEMQVGDLAFFYHSNCRMPYGPGIVGIAQVIRTALPDATAWDPTDKHHDPKCTLPIPTDITDKACRWVSPRMSFQKEYPVILTLKELKDHAKENPESVIASMDLVRRSRLSVTRVTEEQWAQVEAMIAQKKKEQESEIEIDKPEGLNTKRAKKSKII